MRALEVGRETTRLKREGALTAAAAHAQFADFCEAGIGDGKPTLLMDDGGGLLTKRASPLDLRVLFESGNNVAQHNRILSRWISGEKQLSERILFFSTTFCETITHLASVRDAQSKLV
ncbi:MAG TPA: hypothetical protein VJ464_08225 [Blastocatellia bacterium]|nr:hypothetical protein [Blastocatellia bacterium]